MDYARRLSRVSIIGSAGKMGSGILLLMAKELFDLSQDPENRNIDFKLHAIDLSEEALRSVMKYVEKQILKGAERKPETIIRYFEGTGVPESEMPAAYTARVLDLIRPATSLKDAYNSTLVFEAASEDKNLKVKLFKEIFQNSSEPPWFFTNTSSIPIKYIDEQAQLEGCILGFHFYNPPVVQKLVELIATEHTRKELQSTARQLAKRLRKITVPSNDVAGFIGNGHFMRDALYGINEAVRLEKEIGFVKAVYAINTVSQKYLIRPMGIFQLCDYVGLDVVQFIMQVMDPYMDKETLHSPLLDDIVKRGIKGGQNPDGSQKDGFLKYEEGRVTGIYNIYTGIYNPVDAVKSEVNEYLGSLPKTFKPWKEILQSEHKEQELEACFKELKTLDSTGARLAVNYGLNSKNIGLQLVTSGVSENNDNVNKVLLTGFYHAYGPINNFFN